MGSGAYQIMYFASFSELWHMSGHGFYVWSAYGISLLALIVLTVYPIRKKALMLEVIKQRVLHQRDENGDAS
jgi:heme exporter protein D